MTAADIYRSHVFCNAYCMSFFEKTIDKSASFDIIDNVPNELNIWGYSSAGRALEWHSRGQRFDPAYLHQAKSLETQRFRGFFAFYFTPGSGQKIAFWSLFGLYGL